MGSSLIQVCPYVPLVALDPGWAIEWSCRDLAQTKLDLGKAPIQTSQDISLGLHFLLVPEKELWSLDELDTEAQDHVCSGAQWKGFVLYRAVPGRWFPMTLANSIFLARRKVHFIISCLFVFVWGRTQHCSDFILALNSGIFSCRVYEMLGLNPGLLNERQAPFSLFYLSGPKIYCHSRHRAQSWIRGSPTSHIYKPSRRWVYRGWKTISVPQALPSTLSPPWPTPPGWFLVISA